MGFKTSAMSLALLWMVLACQRPAGCQETRPVVSLLQPFSSVTFTSTPDSRSAELAPADDAPVVVERIPAVVTSQKAKADMLTVRVASATSEVVASPSDQAPSSAGGALAACGSNCSMCEGTGDCNALFTTPGGVTWSTCASGCPDGCFGQGGCRATQQCSGNGCGGSCGATCRDWTCLDLCRRQGFWLRADTLLWWAKEDQIPTLVTSSPQGTSIDDAGVLGLPTTSELFTGPLFDDLRVGGRVRFGWWATSCKYGLDASLWGIENQRDQSTWSSAGDPAYARPFFNTDPLATGPDAQLVSFDGTLDGMVRVNSSSEILGGDIGVRRNLKCCTNACGSRSTRFDLFAGYRYFKVREGIRITENLESIALAGPTGLGTTIDLFDDFRTRNEFHGASLGIVAMNQFGRWTTEVSSRVAIGNISREVSINGQTTVTVPGLTPVTRPGGLLAQPTNIGDYEDDEFAILPEVRAELGYNLNCNLKLLVGYSFMYLGEATRPGDIIDPNVNGLQLDPALPLVGPARPQFVWNDSDMWLMGLNLGLEYAF